MAKKISIEEIAEAVSQRLQTMREEVRRMAQQTPDETVAERTKKKSWVNTRNQLRALGCYMQGLPVGWTFTVRLDTLPPALRALFENGGESCKEEELPEALQQLMELITQQLTATAAR